MKTSTVDMNRQKPLIVGVSGVTTGGKTVLCNKLQEEFPLESIKVFKQDNYFYGGDYPHHQPCPGIPSYHNWDNINCINMDNMVEDIGNAITELTSSLNKALIIIDGFLLFDDERLCTLCDLKFFLTLPKDISFKRRSLRHYDAPDPPGYFDLCAWPMYEKYLKRMESIAYIYFIDGTMEFQQIYQYCSNIIKTKL